MANELNIHIMDAGDLVAYAVPTTELEKALHQKLTEFLDENGDYRTAVAEKEEALEDLKTEEAMHTETKNELEELEKQHRDLEISLNQKDDELTVANQRINDLTEELAATLT